MEDFKEVFFSVIHHKKNEFWQAVVGLEETK